MRRDKETSLLLAKTLRGVWRDEPPRLGISRDEFIKHIPLFLGSGTAAMVWRLVRNSDLKDSPPVLNLLEGLRYYAIQNAVIEKIIKEALSLFRSREIEPILIKGWAIARLYPEKGLRLCGDIDLVVRPDQYSLALDLVTRHRFPVDLHSGLSKLDLHPIEELYDRSQLVRLDETDVRLLSPEDHLRILCLHFLRDGAWLPRGLCDIALAVESRPQDFDWDICLGKNRRRADWVACAVGLAHQLLGADTDDTPLAERAANLPRWLLPAVLRQWENPVVDDRRPPELISESLSHPSHIPKAIRRRWPDPIRATVRLEASFDEFPRLPLQAILFLRRIEAFVNRLPALLRKSNDRK